MLGEDELAYRQSVRDMERCLTVDGQVPRRQRAVFERFLHHEDPRVRSAAEEVVRAGAASRAYWRAVVELDDEWVATAARGEVDRWDRQPWDVQRSEVEPWDLEPLRSAPWEVQPWDVDPWGDPPWGEPPSGEEPSGEGPWCRVEGDPNPAGGGEGSGG